MKKQRCQRAKSSSVEIDRGARFERRYDAAHSCKPAFYNCSVESETREVYNPGRMPLPLPPGDPAPQLDSLVTARQMTLLRSDIELWARICGR